MIRWFLLFSLFCKSTQDANGQENGVSHCGPQNLKLNSSDQMIMLTWEDEPSCSTLHDVLIYELVFLIEDKTVDNVEVAVTPEQIGSIHSWKWMSHLALECASHSVRIRSRYKNQTSPWKHEQTPPGTKTSKKAEIFPKDRVFMVGSTVTFCCVLPEGKLLNKMYVADFESNTTQISNQTYAMTVRLEKPSNFSCTHVKCDTDTRALNGGACAYIGYPPDDRDLQCETRNLQSVECHWKVGRKTGVKIKSKTIYHLLGRKCAQEGQCKMDVQVDAGERNWTLTAENQLGKVELTDRADLTKRVHMFPPERLIASIVNARNITLELEWTGQQYYNLNITCQVNISHGETNTITENFGVGPHFVVLNDLKPRWTYDVTVRCGTTPHFWKWSDWSTRINFITKGDVPDAPDVWRQENGNGNVTILWKIPLDDQNYIEDYEVTWAKTEDRNPNGTTVQNSSRVELSLDTSESEKYIITVTARNANGSSSPSTIVIPSLNPDGTERVNTSQIIGSDGSFRLSWSASPTASCGYIVDWCATLKCSNLEWLKVAPDETSASIFSKTFTDGVRYSFSVYACTQEAPVLLERREGYVHEKSIENGLFKSLKFKQQGSDVEVSWDQINLREQSAFIRGYALYCEANNKIISHVTTDNIYATSLKVTNLLISSYTFIMKAKTTDGECGTTTITATLNSLNDTLINSVIICLFTVFVVLSVITVLCYRHWACIKQKFYPPIPKPVLAGKWFPSQGENYRHPLCVDQHHSEGDIMNVSELQCNSVALENGYISQEYMPLVFSQTPKGYYNQPLKISIPPPLTFTATAVPSQSEAPCSPFNGVFPNPSYNLIMQECTTGDQQSNSDSELQEGTLLERSSSGYQPQSNTETFAVNQTTDDPESPMFCGSTYILLPKSPSD